jgi:hypothetical protein
MQPIVPLLLFLTVACLTIQVEATKGILKTPARPTTLDNLPARHVKFNSAAMVKDLADGETLYETPESSMIYSKYLPNKPKTRLPDDKAIEKYNNRIKKEFKGSQKEFSQWLKEEEWHEKVKRKFVGSYADNDSDLRQAGIETDEAAIKSKNEYNERVQEMIKDSEASWREKENVANSPNRRQKKKFIDRLMMRTPNAKKSSSIMQ